MEADTSNDNHWQTVLLVCFNWNQYQRLDIGVEKLYGRVYCILQVNMSQRIKTNSQFSSSTHEQTLDACYSININNHLVPIISMTRETRFLLGEPYSQCRKHKHMEVKAHDLNPKLVVKNEESTPVSKYFTNYTKRQCYLDCFLRFTERNCSCRAFYFPKPVNASERKFFCYIRIKHRHLVTPKVYSINNLSVS